MDGNFILSEAKKHGAAVCGLGISNLPLTDFLYSRGVPFTVRDRRKREQTDKDILTMLEKRGIPCVFGENYLDGMREKVIFRTPGIRPDEKGIAEAVKRGSILTSEMELFLKLTPATVIGITGSDGKTTTTTLTYMFLGESGFNVYVGGNIGEPLLPKTDIMTKNDFAVVELSSFQLMTAEDSPYISAVTNLSPNHLNWHKDMDEYIRAKTNIFSHEKAEFLTVNRENEITVKMAESTNCEVTLFSSKKGSYEEVVSGVKTKRDKVNAIYIRDGHICFCDGAEERKILKTDDILLPGNHNIENYMTAIGNTIRYVTPDDIAKVAKTFGGVEHRLEFVREVGGIRYYNSSIDSSPTRTAAALSAMRSKPVVICGGCDKNIPFEPLAVSLCEKAAAVALTGATKDKIYKAITECGLFKDAALPVEICENFDDAVYAAGRLAEKYCVGNEKIVLLSPACASFDRFKNFEERGKYFKNIVNSLDRG